MPNYEPHWAIEMELNNPIVSMSRLWLPMGLHGTVAGFAWMNEPRTSYLFLIQELYYIVA